MPLHCCELCGVRCSSAVVLADHMTGRKHLLVAEIEKSRVALAARSVFLAHLDSVCDRDMIEAAMSAFGVVDRVLLDRAVDQGLAQYAIVEFRRAEDARRVLHEHRRVQIGSCLAQVRERKMNFNSTRIEEDLGDFTCAEVMNVLRSVASADEIHQIDALVAHFTLSSEMHAERVTFAQQLTAYLQQFFTERILVRPFGSTTTELAFYNSDLDLNFVFDPDNTIVNSYCETTTEVQLSQLFETDIETIATTRPISKASFMKLNGAERTQLLTKMINRFRKQSANIASITSARNARYPVVRFYLRLAKDRKCDRPKPALLVCDLSVENMFSERKANFIADICRADVSGKFRRFLFVVKLWAYCNRLLTMKAEEHKQPSGCAGRWKSYALLLLAVGFLQSRGYLSVLAKLPDSTRLAGWPVDYDLPTFDLSGVSFSKLFKEFFAFLYNTVRDSNVHSVRDGKVIPRSQFDSDFTNGVAAVTASRQFRMALVNIQDPFELSHNVAATVSRETLTLFRRVLMFSIVALKYQRPVTSMTDDDRETSLSKIFSIQELKMNFVSSTSSNSAQNALHRKSTNILVVPTGTDRPPAKVVFNAFISLLQDVLLIEQVEDPSAKRFRDEANGGDETALRDGRSVDFLARHRTWLGRRLLRRKLAGIHVIDASSLLLEREVSRELYVSGSGDKQPPEILRFNVQLQLAEAGSSLSPPPSDNNGAADDDLIMDHDRNDELPAHEPMDDPDTGSELYVIFRPTHDSTPAQCQECRDLMHFLSTFLSKHLPMLVGNMLKRRPTE